MGKIITTLYVVWLFIYFLYLYIDKVTDKTIDLLNEEFKTTDELQTALYSVVKDGVLADKELKQTQKRYFQISPERR